MFVLFFCRSSQLYECNICIIMHRLIILLDCFSILSQIFKSFSASIYDRIGSRLCGSILPSQYISDTNFMLLRFVTKGQNTYKGFLANFKALNSLQISGKHVLLTCMMLYGMLTLAYAMWHSTEELCVFLIIHVRTSK